MGVVVVGGMRVNDGLEGFLAGSLGSLAGGGWEGEWEEGGGGLGGRGWVSLFVVGGGGEGERLRLRGWEGVVVAGMGAFGVVVGFGAGGELESESEGEEEDDGEAAATVGFFSLSWGSVGVGASVALDSEERFDRGFGFEVLTLGTGNSFPSESLLESESESSGGMAFVVEGGGGEVFGDVAAGLVFFSSDLRSAEAASESLSLEELLDGGDFA